MRIQTMAGSRVSVQKQLIAMSMEIISSQLPDRVRIHMD